MIFDIDYSRSLGHRHSMAAAALFQLLVPQLQKGFQFMATRMLQNEAVAFFRYRSKLRERPLKIFVAYDWDDEIRVRRMLFDKLQKDRCFKLWLDKESEIKGHTDAKIWEPILLRALAETDCVIVCLSNEAINNRGYFKKREVAYILKEAKKQRELSTYVILVKLEKCATPAAYRQWPLADLHQLHGYDTLAKTIVRQAYEEHKRKRDLTYKSPLLNGDSLFTTRR